MLLPNFSESQLQTVCNTEFCKLLGGGVYPIVPSLNEEKNLGWDSGFIIGTSSPAPNQKGCNFFVQYKLGTLIEGPRGAQYINWYEPYFRLQIPHTKRNGKNISKIFINTKV